MKKPQTIQVSERVEGKVASFFTRNVFDHCEGCHCLHEVPLPSDSHHVCSFLSELSLNDLSVALKDEEAPGVLQLVPSPEEHNHTLQSGHAVQKTSLHSSHLSL